MQDNNKTIPVSPSNRHIHLSQDIQDILFGKNYSLKKSKDLSQPGQFACEETVRIIGPKAVLEKVRILGPLRKQTQVEISITDARIIGVENVPIRDSGDLDNTPGILIVGPKGSVQIEKGVIIALRHIHMTTAEAESFNLKDKETVKVKIASKRPLIFENVLIRVSDSFALDMHIDIDEGNAAGIAPGDCGTIIKI